MKKLLIITLLFFLNTISGCGDGGGNDSNGNSSNLIDNPTPTLSDIVGVWDYVGDDDEVEDIYYMVIRETGEILGYDFMGDDFDQGKDCYEVDYDDEWLTEMGGGRFNLSTSDGDKMIFDAKIEDGLLVVDSLAYGRETYLRKNLSESDLTPLCNGLY